MREQDMRTQDIQIGGNRSYSSTMVVVGLVVVIVALIILMLLSDAATGTQTPNVYIQGALQYVGYWPMGMVLACVGIFLVIYHASALRFSGPLLTISDAGVTYHRFGPNPLPWNSIEAAALDEPILGLSITERVRLRMDAPAAVLDQQPTLQRTLRKLMRPYDKDNFIIHTAELTITAGELETIIRRRLHR